MATTASETRKRLLSLIEEVNDNHEAVEILSKGGTVFLVPEAQWRSLQETAHLMRSPANAQRLLDSVTAVERGDFAEHELLSPDGESTPQAS